MGNTNASRRGVKIDEIAVNVMLKGNTFSGIEIPITDPQNACHQILNSTNETAVLDPGDMVIAYKDFIVRPSDVAGSFQAFVVETFGIGGAGFTGIGFDVSRRGANNYVLAGDAGNGDTIFQTRGGNQFKFNGQTRMYYDTNSLYPWDATFNLGSLSNSWTNVYVNNVRANKVYATNIYIGTNALSLTNLGDVAITDPASGDQLQFDGTSWVNFQAGGTPPPLVTYANTNLISEETSVLYLTNDWGISISGSDSNGFVKVWFQTDSNQLMGLFPTEIEMTNADAAVLQAATNYADANDDVGGASIPLRTNSVSPTVGVTNLNFIAGTNVVLQATNRDGNVDIRINAAAIPSKE